MDDRLDDPFDLEGTTLRGKYAVGPVVARGGFGVVYRARHLDLDVPVALKVLSGTDRVSGAARAEFLDRFRQEARTLAGLNHPALARVVDYDTLPRGSGDVPWMVLDWIDGRTLEADLRARDGRGRSPREALDLLRPAFDALACAHEAGVSHRDLKPSNLMLVHARRGEPPLRVIDFGVAKVAPPSDAPASGRTATRSEVPAFSALYAAPEQVAGTRTGPWTDVHALALLLTEVLTGARAYRGDDGAALLQEVVGPARPTPGRRGVDVGPWEVVLERALAVVPADRPPSAAVLYRELEAAASEAQAAWEASPRAVAAAPSPLLAETLADARPAPPRPRAAVPADDGAVPPRRRPALALGLAAVAAVAVTGAVLALRERPPPRSPRAPPPAGVVAPPAASPAPGPAPSRPPGPPGVVEAAPAPAPGLAAAPARRPARPRPAARRATPAAAEPPAATPYVAIE